MAQLKHRIYDLEVSTHDDSIWFEQMVDGNPHTIVISSTMIPMLQQILAEHLANIKAGD